MRLLRRTTESISDASSRSSASASRHIDFDVFTSSVSMSGVRLYFQLSSSSAKNVLHMRQSGRDIRTAKLSFFHSAAASISKWKIPS